MDVVFEQYLDFGIMRDEFGFVLDGFWETLQLSLVSGVLALLWGLVLALLRQLPGRGASRRCAGSTIAYIDVFRGVPLLLVVLIISGSLPFVAEELGLPRSVGIPQWFGKPDPFWYGALAITLTYGAYMAEVYRSGIEGVPRGQMEAARALGMSHARAMRHVIVPQAVRRVIPPLLNDFIALMKDTSLVGRDRAARGRRGRPDGPGRDVQQLRADARGADVPGGDAPAGADRRPLHRARARRVPSAGSPPRRVTRERRRSQPMLELQGVHKRFGELHVLRGIDLVVPKGSVVCVIGPSGSGQEHAAALREPARAARRGHDRARGRGDHARRQRSTSTTSAGAWAWSSSSSTCSRTSRRSRTSALRRRRCSSARATRRSQKATRAARPGGALRQGVRVPGPALGRAAAARRDRPRARDGPPRDAVRRGHERARPRARQGGARRDARPGRPGDDDGRRHPRDAASPATWPTGWCSWTRA